MPPPCTPDKSKTRKRYRKEKADGESSSETPSGEVARKKKTVPKKVKSACATPSTSHYAGVGEAQQKLSALKRRHKDKELKERAAAYEQKTREAKRKHGYGSPLLLLENKTVPELQQVVLDEAWAIANNASMCSNLKGTIEKAFKERAANLRSVMEELLRRSLSEETLRMQATIDRLLAEVERSLVRCKCTATPPP
ncbi:hypothetical protein ABMA28_009131 [Loxostege sticticalis]|uniref:Uncharacterized protein n=1 Tax=Loxostege sticticalis TaxID=481309 RepID=A0ABD0SC96_LOXSC